MSGESKTTPHPTGTPLTRGELDTPVTENSPSSLKGWQSKTDGVDATNNKIPPSTTPHPAGTPLTRGESQAPATENSPSSLKGWQSKTDGVDAYHINQHIIQKKFTPNLPRNSSLKNKAKALRKAGVLSEVLFWQQVHRKKFYGIDFDRQCIIGNYIVDFYVPSLSLVIEIDGQSHDHKGAYDEQRQSFLISLGLNIYRIQDGDVKSDLSHVMLRLEDFIIKTYAVEQHPATPLIKEELKAPTTENSPSSLKGWQSKTDGVDATNNKIPPSTTPHPAGTPLSRGESQPPATGNSPSSLKGWQSKTGGVDATKKNTTP